MDNVIGREPAEEILKSWETRFDVEAGPEEKESLLKAIMQGRLEFDEAEETFSVQLLKHVQLENGAPLKKLVIREPSVGDFAKAQKKGNETEETISLVSTLTGQPEGIIRRMKIKDFTLAGLVMAFFV